MWGGTGGKHAGEDVQRLIGRFERKGKQPRYNIITALDYGCGQQTLAAAVPELKWSGYDPGIVAVSEKPSGRFDLVTCTDVMEHIEREYVEEVLQEICDYAKVLAFIEVACTAAHNKFASGPRMGQDVHITQRPPEWWQEKVEALTGTHLQAMHTIGKQVRGEWRTRIKLTIEKL